MCSAPSADMQIHGPQELQQTVDRRIGDYWLEFVLLANFRDARKKLRPIAARQAPRERLQSLLGRADVLAFEPKNRRGTGAKWPADIRDDPVQLLLAGADERVTLAKAQRQIEEHLSQAIEGRLACDLQACEYVRSVKNPVSREDIRELDGEGLTGQLDLSFLEKHDFETDGRVSEAQMHP